MKIEYRKVNRSNPQEMRFIAEQDSKIPLQFDPDYHWDETSIDARLDYCKHIKPDDFFEIAVLDGKIIGFHLIYKTTVSPHAKAGKIATLWVDASIRGKGVGSELKKRGEQWARTLGLVFLQTAVHPSNKAMVEINMKNGFSLTQYEFIKKL